MKGSRRDGHLLGSHVLHSPQSPPSCPVNTELQQLSGGDVLTNLWCFGLEGTECMWVSPGLAALALTEDIPAAHLGPPCLAPLVGPAKQTKTCQQEDKLLVMLFCPSPSALAFLCIKFPFQFPAAFETPNTWDHAPRNTPNSCECGQGP